MYVLISIYNTHLGLILKFYDVDNNISVTHNITAYSVTYNDLIKSKFLFNFNIPKPVEMDIGLIETL